MVRPRLTLSMTVFHGSRASCWNVGGPAVHPRTGNQSSMRCRRSARPGRRHVQDGRLARAGGAHDRHEPPRLDRQVDILHRLVGPPCGVVNSCCMRSVPPQSSVPLLDRCSSLLFPRRTFGTRGGRRSQNAHRHPIVGSASYCGVENSSNTDHTQRFSAALRARARPFPNPRQVPRWRRLRCRRARPAHRGHTLHRRPTPRWAASSSRVRRLLNSAAGWHRAAATARPPSPARRASAASSRWVEPG